MNTIDLIRELNKELDAHWARRTEIIDLITTNTLSDEAFNKLTEERFEVNRKILETESFLDDLENNFESAVAFS